MKQYNTYKPSGIEWLGEIPEHWDVKRVKDIFKGFGSGTTPNTSVEYYYEDGEISWLNTTDLKNDIIVDTKQKVTRRALKECGLKVYPENSLAIAMYGQGKTRGTVGLLKMPFTTNQASCILYKPFKTNTKYVLYWFIHKYDDIRGLNTGATQPNMNQDFVKFLPLQFPHFIEQTAIANYLDTKTAAIDRKIELLTAKADKYKALRRSLINETVCRGLNPNAALKDSGIEWIGMIPEHWEVKRFKDIAYSITGLTYSPDDIVDEEDGVLVLRSGNIQNGELSFSDNVYVSSVIGKSLFVQKGDILVCSRNGSANLVGKSAFIDQNYNYTWGAFMTVVRSKMGRFLFYALNSDLFKRNMGLFQTSTVNQLTSKMLDNMSFLVPPKQEQIEIVEYLDDKTAHIDTILSNINEQITKLTQLRKTLINDVVTGKIKVTD